MRAELAVRAHAVHGEGPVWDDVLDCLYFVDIVKGQIRRYWPDKSTIDSLQLKSRVGCVALTTSGSLIAALQSEIVHLSFDRNEITKLHEIDEGPQNRFNDGKCDPHGRLWAGTMAVNEAEGAGNLYMVDEKGVLHCMLRGVTISNGLAWSTDAMYYIDSATQRIDRFDYDEKSGAVELQSRRTILIINEKEGTPDGMTIDTSGNLWVAHWGGSRVAAYDPRTGRELERIELPVPHVTSCTFGGRDLKTLYITTSSRDDASPLAGSLFCAAVSAEGKETNRIAAL